MAVPVFDGHNDLLLRLWKAGPDRGTLWPQGNGSGHLDLPRMRRGGLAGGFFAIWVPSDDGLALDLLNAKMDAPPYRLPLPPPVPERAALAIAIAQAGHLHWMARQSGGALVLARSAAEAQAAMQAGRIAAVMHMEGAEAIGTDLDALHLFHAMGLRSLGPVWSRPTAFGHGVPFAFPATPDDGPGLTEAGRRLVSDCNALGIVIDLSHMNAAGFADVARLSRAPLVATHSNAHVLTPSSRNLTDAQLDAIRDSDGMVGLNFATVFLRADGRPAADCGWEPMLRHLDHLLGRLGEDRVGLGSDFDGAVVPEVLGDVAGLPRLLEALRRAGYGEALIERIAWRNWIALIGRTEAAA